MNTLASNLPPPPKFKFSYRSSLDGHEYAVKCNRILYDRMDTQFVLIEYEATGMVKNTSKVKLEYIDYFDITMV